MVVIITTMYIHELLYNARKQENNAETKLLSSVAHDTLTLLGDSCVPSMLRGGGFGLGLGRLAANYLSALQPFLFLPINYMHQHIVRPSHERFIRNSPGFSKDRMYAPVDLTLYELSLEGSTMVTSTSLSRRVCLRHQLSDKTVHDMCGRLAHIHYLGKALRCLQTSDRHLTIPGDHSKSQQGNQFTCI